MTDTAGSVSIIIPAYNRKDDLLDLIGDIYRQSYSDIEIIVVDDSSTEDISAAAGSEFPMVVFLRCSRRSGPSFARNMGILKATGRYMLFLDTDVEITDPNMIKRMVDIMTADSGIAELGGEMFLREGALYYQAGDIAFDGYSKNREAVYTEDNSGFFYCDFIFTSNCFIERKKIIEIGGFDPYFVYPGEDKDIGFRLKKKGYLNCCHSAALLKHKVSPLRGCGSRYYECCRTKLRFALKNKGIFVFLMSPFADMMRELLFIPSRLKRKKTAGTQISRPKRQGGPLLPLYIRAFIWNLRNFRQTLRSRNENFLSDRAMQEFVCYSEKEKLFRKEIFNGLKPDVVL